MTEETTKTYSVLLKPNDVQAVMKRVLGDFEIEDWEAEFKIIGSHGKGVTAGMFAVVDWDAGKHYGTGVISKVRKTPVYSTIPPFDKERHLTLSPEEKRKQELEYKSAQKGTTKDGKPWCIKSGTNHKKKSKRHQPYYECPSCGRIVQQPDNEGQTEFIVQTHQTFEDMMWLPKKSARVTYARDQVKFRKEMVAYNTLQEKAEAETKPAPTINNTALVQGKDITQFEQVGCE